MDESFHQVKVRKIYRLEGITITHPRFRPEASETKGFVWFSSYLLFILNETLPQDWVLLSMSKWSALLPIKYKAKDLG